MAQPKMKEAASPKLTPAKAVVKTVASPATKAVVKAVVKEKVKEQVKEGASKAKSLGDLAGKKIFLNMANDKVASAEGNNPKRGNCRPWFDWYIKGGALKGGCPVEEYFKLGGKSGYVRWDLAHGLITVK